MLRSCQLSASVFWEKTELFRYVRTYVRRGLNWTSLLCTSRRNNVMEQGPFLPRVLLYADHGQDRNCEQLIEISISVYREESWSLGYTACTCRTSCGVGGGLGLAPTLLFFLFPFLFSFLWVSCRVQNEIESGEEGPATVPVRKEWASGGAVKPIWVPSWPTFLVASRRVCCCFA